MGGVQTHNLELLLDGIKPLNLEIFPENCQSVAAVEYDDQGTLVNSFNGQMKF